MSFNAREREGDATSPRRHVIESTEERVASAVLIAGFLAAHEVTEIRGKLSGRPLPWTYTDFPITLRKLRSTGLRIDWVTLNHLGAGHVWERGAEIPRRSGLNDNQVARLIVPIQTTDKVTFEVQGAKLPARYTTGALCYIDQRRNYAIRNAANFPAIHLMLDVYGSDQLRTLVRAATAHGAVASA